jgi:hypothetical protein
VCAAAHDCFDLAPARHRTIARATHRSRLAPSPARALCHERTRCGRPAGRSQCTKSTRTQADPPSRRRRRPRTPHSCFAIDERKRVIVVGVLANLPSCRSQIKSAGQFRFHGIACRPSASTRSRAWRRAGPGSSGTASPAFVAVRALVATVQLSEAPSIRCGQVDRARRPHSPGDCEKFADTLTANPIAPPALHLVESRSVR